ncbi:TPA: hypothetical protein DDZ86_03910 [Candidatus Dependentiae bacterium]|nr:MAG: hypothetical protein UW09_C0003G0136 [candidate division TM6 bacterium GW2011_GWF2_43_87]HBL98762.1 hypothetical protein [Candidatus Dependentiae bacterium]
MKRLALFLGILILFPSCTRYVCWIQRTFRQAEQCDVCYAQEAREFVRCQAIRDYLNTVDIIYVLWINSKVFKAHEGLMYGCLTDCEIVGRDLESVANFEKAQQEKTSFLVLMDGEQKDWSLTLEVGGKCYAPKKILGTTLDRGYRGILGSHITSHQRNVYEVEFSQSVVGSDFSLQVFDGTHKEVFCWCKEA